MPGGWWCCCSIEAECVSYTDAFDRADSSDLGSDWEVIEGDEWAIDDHNLYSADGDGIVLHTSTAPVTRGFYAGFTTVDEAPGDKWRLILNYDEIAGTYYYVEFQRIDANNVKLIVGHSDGGIIDYDQTADINNAPSPCSIIPSCNDTNASRSIHVCLSASGIFATADMIAGPATYYMAWGPASINIYKPRVGFEALSLQPTRFDDFSVQRDTTNLTTCTACPCHCGESGYTTNVHELLLTIVDATGICANLDGMSFTMYRRRGCVWEGVVTLSPLITRCVQITLGDDPTLSNDPCLAYTVHGSGACSSPVDVRFLGATYDIAGPGICGCTTPPGPGGGFWFELTEP